MVFDAEVKSDETHATLQTDRFRRVLKSPPFMRSSSRTSMPCSSASRRSRRNCALYACKSGRLVFRQVRACGALGDRREAADDLDPQPQPLTLVDGVGSTFADFEEVLLAIGTRRPDQARDLIELRAVAPDSSPLVLVAVAAPRLRGKRPPRTPDRTCLERVDRFLIIETELGAAGRGCGKGCGPCRDFIGWLWTPSRAADRSIRARPRRPRRRPWALRRPSSRTRSRS